MFSHHRPDTISIATTISAGTDLHSVGPRIGEILGAIQTGEYRCPMVRHPLGFYCLRVHEADRSERYGLCIHVWRAGEPVTPPTVSRIHLHTWQLFSYILHGRVQNQQIEVRSNIERPTHEVYRVRSAGGDDTIVPTGDLVTFQVTDAQDFGVGERYLVPAGTYHKTAILDPILTVTAMVSENWRPDSQLVLGPRGLAAHSVHRERCEASATKKLAGELLTHLALT